MTLFLMTSASLGRSGHSTFVHMYGKVLKYMMIPILNSILTLLIQQVTLKPCLSFSD